MPHDDDRAQQPTEIRASSSDVRDAIGQAVRASRDVDRVTVRDDSGRARFHVVRPSKPLSDD